MSRPFPSVTRNVIVSWLAHAFTIVVGFFLMPYVIRTLGETSYGTWVFINSLASYAGLLYFGFGDTISRYVARHHAAGDMLRLNRVVTLVYAFYLMMGGVVLAIAAMLALAAPWLYVWEHQRLLEVQATILVLGLNAAVGMVGSVYGGVLMGLRRFDLERAVGCVSDLVRIALIVVFLQREWGLLTIALIYFGITAIENLLCMILAYRCCPELRIRYEFLHLDTLRECSSFSSMAFLNALAYQFTAASDSVVIGIFLGPEAIVPYYVALRLTQFIRQPIEKVSVICMPTAGALSADADCSKLQRFLVQAIGLVCLLSAGTFIGGWYFGGDVIRAWMGDEYVASHGLLMVLLASQVISLPCGIFRAFLFGLGEVRAPALMYLAEAALKVALSVVLCQWWGVAGVAWGTLIPVLFVELTLLLPYSLARLRLSWRRLWNDAIGPQLLPLCALAAYSAVLSGQSWSHVGWGPLVAVTAGGGAVLGLVWLVGQRLQGQRLPSTSAVPSA